MRDAVDPESGQRYTFKHYESEKAKQGDSWRHSRVTLQPVNPDFDPIVLTGSDEGELQVPSSLRCSEADTTRGASASRVLRVHTFVNYFDVL